MSGALDHLPVAKTRAAIVRLVREWAGIDLNDGDLSVTKSPFSQAVAYVVVSLKDGNEAAIAKALSMLGGIPLPAVGVWLLYEDDVRYLLNRWGERGSDV